jgi:hypothetical protein
MRFVNLGYSAGLASAVLFGTLATGPAPNPEPTPITTIGRTTSRTPACNVLRDLVAPSLRAAMDAAAAFTDAQARLGAYGDRTGGIHPNRAIGTLELKRLDPNITAMAKDMRTIRDALGDQRVSAVRTDEHVRALREALQALDDAENDKFNALNGFVESRNMADIMAIDEGMAQMTAANTSDMGPPPGAVRVLPTPEAFASHPTPPPISTTPDHQPNLLPDYVPAVSGTKVDPNSLAARDAQLEATAAARIIAITNVCR